MPYKPELQHAVTAAKQAGKQLAEAFHTGFPSHTNADLEADRLIHQLLTAAFPTYGYLSEELGPATPINNPENHLWLVDPQDGTAAAQRGFRGAAVSIALLRDGLPILGIVHAYNAPDDNGDTCWWAEGIPSLIRNGTPLDSQHAAPKTVLLSQDADQNAVANAELARPLRFRTVPGIAYRLALVAAGEAVCGLSLNAPTSWDVAGGHALLRGAGLDLYNQHLQPVQYDRHGRLKSPATSWYLGGAKSTVEPLVKRDWNKAREKSNFPAAQTLAYLKPGQTIPNPDLLNRAQGCLLGQFAGDSLGSLFEFRSAESIAAQYPTGPELLADGGTFSTIAGQPTDDSELALALARSLVHEVQFVPEKVAEAYVAWKASGPFDIGSTTTTALSAGLAAQKRGNSVATALQQAASQSSQANGALMRISPLGIFGAAIEDPREILGLARTDASLTHPHPVCRDASGLMAATLAHIIHQGPDPRRAYHFALTLARDEQLSQPVIETLEAASTQPPADFLNQQGWVLIALQNAFYQLLHAPTPAQGIIATVRHGGDTDTNAAIAGSLLGAAHGARALPAQWRNSILTCRALKGLPGVVHPRPPVYWPVDAYALAERLLLAGQNHQA